MSPSKLPPETCLAILALAQTGRSQASIAEQFNVTQAAVWYALRRARRGFTEKQCAICGNTFLVSGGRTTYCSWLCSMNAQPAMMYRAKLRRVYKITQQEYDARLEKQGHACAICRRPKEDRPLEVDHNHVTGQTRGLLCGRCNTSLGWYEANTRTMRAYLEEYHGGKTA